MGLIYRPFSECVIMGDMNIDLLKFGSYTKNSYYLDNIFPMPKPTRIAAISITLIDHIYTNIKSP